MRLPPGTGQPARVGPLRTTAEIRDALARICRETIRREGRFPEAAVAQKLASILGTLHSMTAGADLEARLARLEAMTGVRGDGH